MKLELTPAQAKQCRPLLDKAARGTLATPDVIAGQLMRGDWHEPERLFIFLSAIKHSTALKVRKLLAKDLEARSK